MIRFNNFSIRGKILLIVCAGLFFQILISLTGIYYLNQTNRNLAAIVNNDARAIKYGARVNAYFRELVISEKNMLLTKTKDAEVIYRDLFADDQRNLEEYLGKLREIIGPAVKGYLDDFEAYYRQSLDIHHRIHELRDKNKELEAIRLSIETARDHRRRARDKLNFLVEELDKLMGQHMTENQTAIRTAMTMIIGIMVITLIVALSLGLVVTRAITNSLHTLVAATGRLAGGEMSVRTDIQTVDEVGTLATAFNDMADKLQGQTESMRRLSMELETIMDNIPGLVFYKDTKNHYIRVNRYVADAHKMEKQEIEGRSLFDLYPRELAQAYLDDDIAVIDSGKPKMNIDEPWETEKGIQWVSTSKLPYVDEQGKIIGVIGVSMDITERKQAEEALAGKNKLTEAINKIFREAVTCETDEDVAKTALRVAEELTGSKFGWIGEINAAGLMDTIAISNPGWEACNIVVSDAKNFIKNMPLRGIDRATLKEGKSRIVNADQISTHPDRTGIPHGHPPIECFMGVPFKREDKTVGMIALANKDGGYVKEDQEAIETLSVAFYEALLRKRMELIIQEQSILKTAQNELSDQMRGDLATDVLCSNIITYLCNRLKLPTGLIYLAGGDGTCRLAGSYAYKPKGSFAPEYKVGEGLVGQAALEKKEMIITEVPKDYFTIESGLGETLPRCIYIKPIVHKGKVKAVLEFGMLQTQEKYQTMFLETVAESIAITIESAEAQAAKAKLLEETQRQSEELQAQQEELKSANEELEEQTQRLQASEETLKAQQEELQVVNEELEEKTDLLERQKNEVEQARKDIEKKAGELALSSKYKSEFLANMSHELRTPLNSLLLLARGLMQNREGNLTGEQVEAAGIIHGAGRDLLNLINEILDLSKIEAGRMDLQLGMVRVSDLAEGVRASFKHMAKEKGFGLDVVVSGDAPGEIVSDRRRVEQVMRNLLSNAVKFTEKGRVTVTFGRPSAGTNLSKSGLSADECMSIAVRDTGIGIAPEQQKIIFEAFQQADGGTARKYGGTGLGLSISRELTRILGGEIQLESEPDKGSTFTLYLPIKLGSRNAERGTFKRGSRNEERGTENERDIPSSPFRVPRSESAPAPILDDRESISEADRVILIIEDDPNFARILYMKCHEKGFKCLASPNGENGLELAVKHLPAAAILDICLPGMDGWAVLTALKEDVRTRHIPVHIVSVEESSTEALRRGAVGHAVKPLDNKELEEAFRRLEQVSAGKPKRVLVVEDDSRIRRETLQLIGDTDVKVDEAENGKQGMKALRSGHYDCVVLDLGLPDIAGNVLIEQLEREGVNLPPVIIYTARDLTQQEEMDLREHAESIVIKDVRSQERLLDEVSLFLHRVVSNMSENKKQMILNLHDTDVLLKDKKILIVDDDMRTTFALSSLLTKRGMKTFKADNGESALRMLDQEPDIDLVLMDIMMPVMDGYEAIKRIRAQDRFRKLPIIVLTAKAMPEDRAKCVDSGANDYLPKPVDEGRLISIIRVWMYK